VGPTRDGEQKNPAPKEDRNPTVQAAASHFIGFPNDSNISKVQPMYVFVGKEYVTVHCSNINFRTENI
jgi:hypothetical protein